MINKQFGVVFALIAAVLSSGCSTTMKAAQLNEEGRFDTKTVLYDDEVVVLGTLGEQMRGLVYVQTDEKEEDYNEFILSTFRNMGIFERVLDKSELENLVFAEGLTGKVSSISDKIGLHNLYKEIGPFLVVEAYAEWDGGYDYSAKLTAMDPANGENLLELSNEAFNWSGLDKPLFYPLFNSFLEWANGEQITTTPRKTE